MSPIIIAGLMVIALVLLMVVPAAMIASREMPAPPDRQEGQDQ